MRMDSVCRRKREGEKDRGMGEIVLREVKGERRKW